MRILDGVGNEIAEQDGVGAHNANSNILMVNGLSHAWFKKINVRLNGENISFNGNIYGHRGDIEMRLSYPQTVKESSLNMSGFDKEQVAFDDINAANIHFEDSTNIARPHRAILRRYA